MAERVVTTPDEAYAARLQSGDLKPNPTQDAAVDALQRLFDRLVEPLPKAGFFDRFRKKQVRRFQNVYLHGPVGRGKTTIMDLFYDALPFAQKRRTHFHEFMLEIHGRIHRLQTGGGSGDRGRKSNRENPIGLIAYEISQNTRVLCFDEFVVNNIADAMILGRLYQGLTGYGVALVMTSNFLPGELYKNGLQRDRFLPFIEVLEGTSDQIYVDHLEDYRRLKTTETTALKTYFAGPEQVNARGLKAHFENLADGQSGGPVTLVIGSRNLTVPKAIDGVVAWLDFDLFLDQPLGPGDFLAVARRFPAVIIADVPVLTPELRNQARRFMTLIDALYNLNRRVIISADALPDKLYPCGDGSFEFQRTASRLAEMQSAGYSAAC